MISLFLFNHHARWYIYTFQFCFGRNELQLLLFSQFWFPDLYFRSAGSRCLIVAFKLGASIKYPTLYLHQHTIPIFFFLFNLISKIHSIILNIFKHPPLWVFRTSIKHPTLITPHPTHTWYENSCFPPKAINENISNIDCFRIFVIIFIVCLFVRKLAKLVRCPFSSHPSPTNNALSALVSD